MQQVVAYQLQQTKLRQAHAANWRYEQTSDEDIAHCTELHDAGAPDDKKAKCAKIMAKTSYVTC